MIGAYLYSLVPPQIKGPTFTLVFLCLKLRVLPFIYGMSQIKSLVSFMGHNQLTKSHGGNQVLFLTIDYVKDGVSISLMCESEIGLLISDRVSTFYEKINYDIVNGE